ncbi:MAG: TolC family protein [Phycisphaeraceae bacterium]|nr:MAG: TolC family protein [Phycisphaeraceae bacterium]
MTRSTTQHAPGHTLLRVGLLPPVGIAVILVGACQSYERRPLDVPGHLAAFVARTPEGPEVRAFAARLAARDPDPADFNPSDGIGCAEAEIIALVFNADLRLARLRAGVTRATAEHAGLWDDPTISVSLARIIESTPEPWKVSTSVGLTLPISGRLEAEKQRAGAEHAAELARLAQREWSVRMSVRRAWIEWSALNAQLDATRDFLERVDQILPVVDRMEQAGEMARTEARLFRIEKATRSLDLATLESRAREADLRVRQLMGMSPDAPLRFVTGGLRPASSTTTGDISPGDTPAELEHRSPAMLVVIAEYEAAERALELEIRRQYPDLHVGPGFGREDGQDQVLLGLTVPIPFVNANRQRIAQAEAAREFARAGVEATLEQTIAGLGAAWLRASAATHRRLTLETQIVPLVDAQYADARRVATLGEVNTLVLIESLTRQLQAKTSLVEAARDEAIAAVDLDELLGPPPSPSHPIPDSPTAPGGDGL